MNKPKIICMTATKNEAWIIRLFLRCMSEIADCIIIADQMSTDGTREICKKFNKVVLVDNKCTRFNEPERQKIMIDIARKKFPGPRLLLGFDADDIPSSNILHEKEWKDIVNAQPGIPIMLQNVCLFSSPYNYRTNKKDIKGVSYLPYAVIDNNEPHTGKRIHTPRFPYYKNKEPILLKKVVSMHYQFVDMKRAMSKQRWYTCYEKLHLPEMSNYEIIKKYNWVLNDVHKWSDKKVPKEWYEGWKDLGIDMDDFQKQEYFWWDWDILRQFEKYGESRFYGLPVWNVDWEKIRKVAIKKGITDIPNRKIRKQSILNYYKNYKFEYLYRQKILKPIFNNEYHSIKKYFTFSWIKSKLFKTIGNLYDKRN